MKQRIPSIITAIGYIVICGMFALDAPKFGAIYTDLLRDNGKIYLPALTRFVLVLAPIGWILLGGGTALFLVRKDLHMTSRKIANLPFVLALILVTITGIIGLFLPLVAAAHNLAPS